MAWTTSSLKTIAHKVGDTAWVGETSGKAFLTSGGRGNFRSNRCRERGRLVVVREEPQQGMEMKVNVGLRELKREAQGLKEKKRWYRARMRRGVGRAPPPWARWWSVSSLAEWRQAQMSWARRRKKSIVQRGQRSFSTVTAAPGGTAPRWTRSKGRKKEVI